MIGRLDQVASALIALCAAIGTVGLMVEVAVILTDVVGRSFHAPLRGAQDISQMAMVIVVFGGMALCDRVGGHVAVDVFERSLPSVLIRFGDILSAILGAVIFLGIAYTVWESAALSRLLNLSTNIINLPKSWFQYATVGFSLVTALGMSLRAVALILGAPLPKAERI